MAVKKQVARVSKLSLKWRMAGIVALAVVGFCVVVPSYVNKGIGWIDTKTALGLPQLPNKGFNLGLDLQGGAHLIYQADVSQVQTDPASAVEGVRDVIERRVRGGLGVAEPLVQTTKVGGDYRVIVDLPGVTDVNQAIKMIGETPILEFKEQNDNPAPQTLSADQQKQLNAFNAAAQKKAQQALADVQKGMDFSQAVKNYSEDASTTIDNGGNIGFIDSSTYPEIYNWAKSHANGSVSGQIIKSGDGLNIVKLISSKDGEQEVSASHILICYSGAQGCTSTSTKDEALARIEAIKKQATPQNFADLAKKYSADSGSAANGGALGSFKYSDMVEPFAKAAFAMAAGTISDPVETDYGYHLIYKTGVETPKVYEVARIFIKTETASDILPPVSEWKDTGLSGKQLKRADVTQDSNTGQVQVALQFNSDGAQLFADITKRNVGKPVAIFLDNEAISIPRVNEPILNGSAVISGSFTLEEAKLLAQRLNSGALPVPVNLISQQTIGASLGSDSLQKSFYAGIVGLLAVIVFMILYYRLPGILAALALMIYAILALTIFKLIGVTLTLSGIAGFILSIGVAVDANVLVFERLKEELRFGKSLRPAMEEAFLRAWPSIRDSNVSALISCVFLIWFGTGFVQGFAVTLAIGVLVSMFTAIIVTRNIMRLVLGWFKDEANWMFLGHRKPAAEGQEEPAKEKKSIPFIKYSKVWITISGLTVATCLALFAFVGLKLGIDFTGGSLLSVSFSKNLPAIEEMQKTFDSLGYKDSVIQKVGDNGLLVRTNFLTEDQHQAVLKALRDKYQVDGNQMHEDNFQTIGSAISSQLRQRALWAIILVNLGIIIYVAYAFRKVSRPVASWKYGLLAIIALIHDVLLVVGVFVLLGKYAGVEIDTGFVVALLTVLGYSVTDTIVVYDRIRENLTHRSAQDFGEMVNMGLNQTLMRSINTTFITLLPLFSLYFLGGSTIHNFALALLIGIASGAYSSIFIASPLLVLSHQWQLRKRNG